MGCYMSGDGSVFFDGKRIGALVGLNGPDPKFVPGGAAGIYISPAPRAVAADPARESALRFELAKAQREEREAQESAAECSEAEFEDRADLDCITSILFNELASYHALELDCEALETSPSGQLHAKLDGLLKSREHHANSATAFREDAREAGKRAYAAKAELVKMGVWGGE
jgi:hypothetical protein